MQTTSLTQQARALYENSVVPVAAIARLAGVSERTLYKYVQRGGWRRRRAGQDIASAVSKREARRAASPPRPCVTAKGAGGRFIRSADAGLPVRRGLKALDPDGEALALSACAQAEALSDAAVARTARLRESIADVRLLAEMVRLLRQGMPAERRGKGRAQRKPWRPMLVSPLRVAEAAPEPVLSEADRRINAVAAGFYAERSRMDAVPPAVRPRECGDPGQRAKTAEYDAPGFPHARE